MGKEALVYQEQFNPRALWGETEAAWPETKVINPKQDFPREIKAVFALCPLYAAGSLSESDLLLGPCSIAESRVGQKWEALKTTIGAMDGYLDRVGGNLEATVIFANKGVLLNHQSGQREVSALSGHEEVYRAAVGEFFAGLNVDHEFYNYDDLGVRFDRFVDPKKEIPISPTEAPKGVMESRAGSRMIWLLNHYLNTQAIPGEVVDNKKNRKPVEQLIKSFGFTPTFWIVAGYLAFDHLLPDLLGDNGIYLSAERFGQLFKIARFTEGLKTKPRVEITA